MQIYARLRRGQPQSLDAGQCGGERIAKGITELRVGVWILQTARERNATLIGLSGLITPSLDEMVHVATEMERQGFRLPLLIGGATTSRKHTAIKIAPAYEGATVHVLDASRAVDVVGQLTSETARDPFVRKVREEQESDRRRHEEGPPKKLVPYEEALERRLELEWDGLPFERPAFLGRRVLPGYPLQEIVPYIDWSPFFHAWELRGVYPAILDHPERGPAARELFEAGRALLERIVRDRLLTANAVYGFFAANSDGDDVVLYADEAREKELVRFHMLRQQLETADRAPRLALSDFIAPRRTGRADYLGAFAVTAGVNLERLTDEFEREHDDYQSILAKALADRLAEAFAERLHETARREWGYGRDERLSKEDLLKERYRGIRPAPGYPACPDHSEKRILWDLLGAREEAGIALTESCAMYPAASVSGFYFAHPEARYFSVGKIGRDQVAAYAARKGVPVEEVERWLAGNLAYDARPANAPARG